MERSKAMECHLQKLIATSDARSACDVLSAIKHDPTLLTTASDLQVDRILDFIIQQLSDCTSKTTAHGSSNDSDATAQKQLCKHLLHTVALISEAQLYRCLSAIVTAHGTPENGINSNISRGLQLLNALRSHLQLPHSTKSLSISQLVYQCLERVLKCIIEQQQQQTPSSKQSPGSKQQNRCPANRTSKDICKAAAAALPQQFQQQLLLQLQPCYSAVWHARLLLAGDLQDIVSARFSLQIQAAAHRCLLLLQTLYIIAGTKQQMQQQLLGLVSGNNHEVKEEGQKADDSCKQRQQQQQQQIPLATVLKQLLDNYKAAQKLTGDPGSSSSSKQRSRITPPPSPAAAAAAATGLRPGVDAAAVMAMSSELCVSGIQAWGLMAGQLGPLFLDKSVGQPMLTMLQWVFTTRNPTLRLQAFSAWCGFIYCCQQLKQIYRKRAVLLQPANFALQHDSCEQVKVAAVASWGCMVQAMLGQQPCMVSGIGDLGLDFGVSSSSRLAAAAAAKGDFAGWLQGVPQTPAGHEQQQQPCEGMTVQAFESIVKPMIVLVLGSNSSDSNISSSTKGGGSNNSKSAKDTSCWAALPIVQLVLQQTLLHSAAAAAASAGDGSSKSSPSASKSSSTAATVTVKPEAGAAAAIARELAGMVCDIVSSICSSRHAAAVLAAVAAAGEDPAAAVLEGEQPTPRTACKTPAARVQQQQQRDAGSTLRLSTPPPSAYGVRSLVAAAAAAAEGAAGTPVTPAVSSRKFFSAPTPVLLLPLPTPAAEAAAAGVTPDPVWILQSAPGWLQLLASCFQQLLLLPTAAAKEQQHQLWQQWLPAWNQVLQLIGAAARLVQHKQVAQGQHAESPPQQGSTRKPGRGDKEQQQQGAFVQQAIYAAVQAAHALHLVSQAHVGSNDGSSIEGRSVCGLLVQAVAACIWPLPADMLATALPAAAAELPLPVCLSAAAAAAGATNHAEQQQQQMTPNKWARQQQQQQQVNTAGRLCWQILAEVLLDVYAQLPADSSTSTEPAATAAAGPGPLVPAAVGDDGSSSHLRGQQTEQQLLSCLSCCCQVAQGSNVLQAALELLGSLAKWPEPSATASAAQGSSEVADRASARKLTAWCMLVQQLLLRPHGTQGTAAAGVDTVADDTSKTVLSVGIQAAVATDSGVEVMKQLAAVLIAPLNALKHCCQSISTTSAKTVGSDALQQQQQQQQQQETKLGLVQWASTCWCGMLQGLLQGVSNSLDNHNVSKATGLQLLLQLRKVPAAVAAAFGGASVTGWDGHFNWLTSGAASGSSSSAGSSMQVAVLSAVAAICCSLEKLVHRIAEVLGQHHTAAVGAGGSSRPSSAKGAATLTPTKATLGSVLGTAAATATAGSSACCSVMTEKAAAKTASRLAVQQQQVQAMTVACMQLCVGMINTAATTSVKAGGSGEEGDRQQHATVCQQLVSSAAVYLCCMCNTAAAADVLDQHLMPALLLLLLDKAGRNSSTAKDAVQSGDAAEARAVGVLGAVVPVLLEWLLQLQGTVAATAAEDVAADDVSSTVQRSINSVSPLLVKVFSLPQTPPAGQPAAAAAAGGQLQSTTYQLLNRLLEFGSVDTDTQLLTLPVQLQEVLADLMPSGLITGSLALNAGYITPRKPNTAVAAAKSPAAAAVPPASPLPGKLAAATAAPKGEGVKNGIGPISPAQPSFIPPAANGATPVDQAGAAAVSGSSSKIKAEGAMAAPAAIAPKRRNTLHVLDASQTEYVQIPAKKQRQDQQQREFVGRKRRASVKTYTTLDNSQPVVDGSEMVVGHGTDGALLPSAAAPAASSGGQYIPNKQRKQQQLIQSAGETNPQQQQQPQHQRDEKSRVSQPSQTHQHVDTDMVAATQDEDVHSAAAASGAPAAAAAAGVKAGGTDVDGDVVMESQPASEQRATPAAPASGGAGSSDSSPNKAPKQQQQQRQMQGASGMGAVAGSVPQPTQMLLQQQSMPATLAAARAVPVSQQQQTVIAGTAVVPTQLLQQQSLPATAAVAAGAPGASLTTTQQVQHAAAAAVGSSAAYPTQALLQQSVGTPAVGTVGNMPTQLLQVVASEPQQQQGRLYIGAFSTVPVQGTSAGLEQPAATAGNPAAAAAMALPASAAASSNAAPAEPPAVAAAADVDDDMDALDIDPSQQWMPGQHKAVKLPSCRLPKQQQQQYAEAVIDGQFKRPGAAQQRKGVPGATAAVAAAAAAGGGVPAVNLTQLLSGIGADVQSSRQQQQFAKHEAANPDGCLQQQLLPPQQQQPAGAPADAASPTGQALHLHLAGLYNAAAAGNGSSSVGVSEWLQGLSGSELCALQSAVVAALTDVSGELAHRVG